MSILFNMPLNEREGSKKADDYGTANADGEVIGEVDFVPLGLMENCAEFSGYGYIATHRQIVVPSSNWTLSAWLKVPSNGLVLYAKSDIGEVSCDFAVPADEWFFLAVVKEGTGASVYVSNAPAGETTIGTNVVALAILQQNEKEYSECLMNYVKLYDYAMSIGRIKLISTMATTTIDYTIDGTSFRDLGVYVSDSDGLLDRPKMKTPYSVDWLDSHGTNIDLDEIRLGDREISLKCFIKADSKLEFAQKCNEFMSLFDGAGLRRLKVGIDASRPLVYDVYLSNEIAVDKRWSNSQMVGEFTLSLIEPRPVKRVISFEASDTNKTLTISCTQEEGASLCLFNVAWGDGSSDEEFSEQAKSLSHEYTPGSTYHAIISGVIDNLDSTTTNGIIIWDKI